ncbi:MAG TPA: DUF5689 domain-containing protein [Ohtaekwangia sp.]|uniref:DUF5689 domain-containing protein n=1 Tax=Ohtaekwangia sp. TaxID=2066019 RepID=UPI002F941402
MKQHYLFIFLLTVFSIGAIRSSAQVNLGVINSSYQQNFDSLASTGTTNDIATLPTGWTFSESGTNANTTYAAGTGSSNAGNTYSFGLTAADRALGGLLSGSLIPTIGAGFTNNTGSAITSLQINYRGEQWRLGASGRGADRLDFQFSLDATSLTSGTWTDIDALDFSSRVTIGTVGALNGNDTTNSKEILQTISGLSIEPGATFYIRWVDFNVSGSDDGLAIDNFILTPIGLPSNVPSIRLVPESLNFGDVTVNDNARLRYQVIGANLQDSIKIFAFSQVYTLSVDSIHFNSVVTLPPDGGYVHVKFAPVAPGLVTDSLAHFSGTAFSVEFVKGNGFDFVSSVIPIATARTKAVGEKVTVGGRITVGNELGNPAYIQDATGGIPVFDYTLANSVSIGDSVIVTGPIGLFNDQKQISGAGIAFIKPDSSKKIIAPKSITLDQLAANEGLLVKVQRVTLADKSFVFYPQSTETMIGNGIQGDLRIDGDTDIPGLSKPQDTVSITGVVGRFRTNAQLMPRFQADIPGAVVPTPASDSIARDKTLDVVNWNLEFFGAKKEDYSNEEYGPEDEDLQLANVRRVLDSLQADIVAVQEVSNDSLFRALIAQLGKYRAVCSDRYSYSFDGPSNTFPPQKVCFIYDTATVKIVSARPLFEELYDKACSTNPELLPGYPGGSPSSFFSSGRLPYMLTVNATVQGVTEKVSLVDIHAKSGSTADDRSRRLYDAQVLKDSLDAYYPDEQIIVLGDLNDDLDQSIVTGLGSPYVEFVNDTANYIPVTKHLSDAGARSTTSFQDVIDHQVITNDLSDEYIAGSERVITPFRLIQNYATTTSDHLPVMVRYQLRAPEVSFTQQGLSLQESNTNVQTISLSVSKPLSAAKQIVLALTGDATYGKDFVTEPAAVNNRVVITIPADSLHASFTIRVQEDKLDELAETATFTILSGDGLQAGDQPAFTLTIEDNDVPTVAFAELLPSAKEGSGIYDLKLNLSTPVASDQTVTLYVTQGPGVVYGEDYTTEPALEQQRITVDVPAGSNNAVLAITPLQDGKRELPIELISFYLEKTSDGLLPVQPRISIFSILDVKKRQPHVIASPNPTTGVVRLICAELENGETVQAELRGPSGELLYNGSGTLDQLSTIFTSKVQQHRRGIYTINVWIDGDVIAVRVLKI